MSQKSTCGLRSGAARARMGFFFAIVAGCANAAAPNPVSICEEPAVKTATLPHHNCRSEQIQLRENGKLIPVDLAWIAVRQITQGDTKSFSSRPYVRLPNGSLIVGGEYIVLGHEGLLAKLGQDPNFLTPLLGADGKPLRPFSGPDGRHLPPLLGADGKPFYDKIIDKRPDGTLCLAVVMRPPFEGEASHCGMSPQR